MQGTLLCVPFKWLWKKCFCHPHLRFPFSSLAFPFSGPQRESWRRLKTRLPSPSSGLPSSYFFCIGNIYNFIFSFKWYLYWRSKLLQIVHSAELHWKFCWANMSETINVKIKPSTGNMFQLELDLNNTTVSDLKRMVGDKMCAPAIELKLVFAGRILKDQDLCADCSEWFLTGQCLQTMGITESNVSCRDKRREYHLCRSLTT